MSKNPLRFFHFNGKESGDIPETILNGGKHVLQFAQGPRDNTYLSTSELLAQEVPMFVSPHTVFMTVPKVTSLHQEGVPVTEFQIEVPEDNNLLMTKVGKLSSIPLAPGKYTLVRYKENQRFLVIKEWLDQGPIGLPEHRWLWLWYSNIWKSWQTKLLRVGNLMVLTQPSSVTEISSLEPSRVQITAASG